MTNSASWLCETMMTQDQIAEFVSSDAMAELWALLDEGLDFLSWWYAPSDLEKTHRCADSFWNPSRSGSGPFVAHNKCLLNLMGLCEAMETNKGGYAGDCLLGGLKDTAESRCLLERLADMPRGCDHCCGDSFWSLKNREESASAYSIEPTSEFASLKNPP